MVPSNSVSPESGAGTASGLGRKTSATRNRTLSPVCVGVSSSDGWPAHPSIWHVKGQCVYRSRIRLQNTASLLCVDGNKRVSDFALARIHIATRLFSRNAMSAPLPKLAVAKKSFKSRNACRSAERPESCWECSPQFPLQKLAVRLLPIAPAIAGIGSCAGKLSTLGRDMDRKRR